MQEWKKRRTGLSSKLRNRRCRSRTRAILSGLPEKRMARSRAWVETAVRTGCRVWRDNGFGAFQNVSISPDHLRELQRNLILSHVRRGDPCRKMLPGDDLLRPMRCKGFSGFGSDVERLLIFSMRRRSVVPAQGPCASASRSLSHIVAVLTGRKRSTRENAPGRKALKMPLKPVVLEAKEGSRSTMGRRP